MTTKLLVIVILLMSGLPGCSNQGKPSADDCRKAIDKMFAIWAGADPSAAGNRDKVNPAMNGLIKSCQEKWSLAKVECLQKAATKPEADRCG